MSNLSEEEKREQLEFAKKLLDTSEGFYVQVGKPTFIMFIDIIAEQQKEIEELKEFIVFCGGKDIEDISATKYMKIRREGYIDGIKAEREKSLDFIKNNAISKDKIREKMEYYTELYKQDNSPNDFLISQACLSKLSLLQELLGEE